MRTELPIRVTPVADWISTLAPVCALLAQCDHDAARRLAMIARDYIDGRRTERERVTRPDGRKSLELLSAVAGRCCGAVMDLPAAHQDFLDAGLKDDLRSAAWPKLPSEIGTSLLELADYDLLNWVPNTPVELRPAVSHVRCLLEELGSRCAALPMQAEWGLIQLEHTGSPDGESERPHSLYTVLDRLRTTASVAAELMKRDRGPRSDTLLMRAVLRLKDEFARRGLVTTHNPKDTTGYIGVGSSPFDLFVHTFFTAVEPNNTQRRGLNHAILFACRWDRTAPATLSKSDHDERIRDSAELVSEPAVTNFSPES